jgi:hypothetical protein
LHLADLSGAQTVSQFEGNNSVWAGVYTNALSGTANSFYGYKIQGVIKGYEYMTPAGDWNLYTQQTSLTVLSTGNVGVNTNSISSDALFAVKDGHIEIQQTTLPVVSILGSAGVGASTSITNSGPRSNDVCGKVTITSGTTSIGTGGYATVTFNKPYLSTPVVILTPANANAANAEQAYGVYVTANVNGFTINFANALPASVSMQFNYIIMTTQ